MGISHYIREIGRGKEGARALSEEKAFDLMSQVLAGEVSDLELGAFAIAMRIKGETIPELAGFLRATAACCMPLQIDRPALVLPSYNGARKLPNLTPLLACLLARSGIPVLVHGMPEDRTRVTSAQIFESLGLAAAGSRDEVLSRWSRGEPAYVRTDVLCPPLARLLDVRWTIGLRNSGHTIAKLLAPFPSRHALRVVNYTHPEYGHVLTDFLGHVRADAMLMRGTEGEPVADARRQPRLQIFIDGAARDDLSQAAREGVLGELPSLPREFDADSTARYTEAVLAGDSPLPAPIALQVQCLSAALACLPSPLSLCADALL